MTDKEGHDLAVPEHGMQFDFTGKVLRKYLEQFRKDKIPCPVCHTDKWGTLETRFLDGEFRVIPDSITPAEYEAATDLLAREDMCARGNYNFICGNCGFCLSFNALFVATMLHQQAANNKNSDEITS